MFRRISLLTVDAVRPSSIAMARMLRRAWNRSAIVIRSDSERNRAEITAVRWREIGAYFLMSPDFKTTAWPCRPVSSGTTANTHDPAGLRIALSPFH